MPSPLGAVLFLCHDFLCLLEPEDVRKQTGGVPTPQGTMTSDRNHEAVHITYRGSCWLFFGAHQSFPVYLPHRGYKCAASPIYGEKYVRVDNETPWKYCCTSWVFFR